MCCASFETIKVVTAAEQFCASLLMKEEPSLCQFDAATGLGDSCDVTLTFSLIMSKLWSKLQFPQVPSLLLLLSPRLTPGTLP